MRRLAVVVVALVVGTACGRDEMGSDPGSVPSMSLGGGGGVHATVERTVTLVDAVAGPDVVSVLDTAIWAPFDGDGAAFSSDTAAGIPAPVGRLASETYGETGWSRWDVFRDSSGVLHELSVEADGPGPATRIEYRRSGRLAVMQDARWTRNAGGWTLADGAVTYLPVSGPAVRVSVRTSAATLARRDPVLSPFARAAVAMAGMIRPEPLAAQFYFGACSRDWLVWGGAALLAEAAWVKFAKSKTQRDFKLATAATATAGVALDKLVDCMLRQDQQPKLEQP